MKREDEFLQSIYEKRDAALEKRRNTLRFVKRAGISFASLFAVAVITVVAVIGSGMSKSAAEYDRDAEGYLPLVEELSAEGSLVNADETEAATKYETKAPDTKAAEIEKPEKDTTAAFTQVLSPTGPAVEKRRVETEKAEGEENAKKDFENMLTLFGLSGESFGGSTCEYGEEAVEVYKMFTSNGSMYIFRYGDNYCCVADPSPELSAADAIKLADDAINAQ